MAAGRWGLLNELDCEGDWVHRFRDSCGYGGGGAAGFDDQWEALDGVKLGRFDDGGVDGFEVRLGASDGIELGLEDRLVWEDG